MIAIVVRRADDTRYAVERYELEYTLNRAVIFTLQESAVYRGRERAIQNAKTYVSAGSALIIERPRRRNRFAKVSIGLTWDVMLSASAGYLVNGAQTSLEASFERAMLMHDAWVGVQ